MNKRNFFSLKGLVLCLSSMLIFSCSTVQIAEVNPFATIGNGADIYVYAPVEGNEDFVDIIIDERVNKKDVKTALSRTKTISIGVFNAKTSPSKKDETLICAQGNYPASFTDMIFEEKNGWTKAQAENGVSYYSGGVNSVSMPNNKNTLLVLASSPASSMEKFLGRAGNVELPGFTESFETFVAASPKGTVGIFLKNPNSLFASLVGTDLQLPLQSTEIYLTKQPDGTYKYSFSIETKSSITAFGISVLLRGFFNANIRTEGLVVHVENGILTKEQLSDLLKKVLSY